MSDHSPDLRAGAKVVGFSFLSITAASSEMLSSYKNQKIMEQSTSWEEYEANT